MADQVLSRTLNQKFDTVFEEVTHQETLNLLNRNDLKLFCLDIETNQFNYDPLVEFLEDNLGMYVFSRAELDELVDAGKDRTVALKAVRRLIKTGNPGEKGTGSELGEILDYCFFEHVLEAPKILSKYEQVTAGGTYKAQSEGVHLLSVGKAGAPAYQLVYGASGIIDDIQDAIDKAFEEIAAVSNGQRKERQVVDSTVMGRSFDEDTTARLKEILLPSKTRIPVDNAYGMFLNMLEYKLKDRGGYLIKVEKFYPSSQLCHYCGYRNQSLKDLRIRKWDCPHCGHQGIDRDYNAAINIKVRGLEILESV